MSDAGDSVAGTLYLLPVPLGDARSPLDDLPAATLSAVRDIDCFIAENARSARAALGRMGLSHPLQALEIHLLDEHTPAARLPELLAPLRAGRHVGLLSEAGCPAVADPGAALVALAHREGVPVVPLIGPSALLLALMASGMSGQSFAFVGYLPVPQAERQDRIRALERRARSEGQTQIVIETPYRNAALLACLLGTLSPDMLLGVAAELTLAGEAIRVAPVARWRASPPSLPKAPAVFLIGADGQARLPRPGVSEARERGRPRR
jgi:16S rRNA (cytidine1402-2'-O)-methyltransferase